MIQIRDWKMKWLEGRYGSGRETDMVTGKEWREGKERFRREC